MTTPQSHDSPFAQRLASTVAKMVAANPGVTRLPGPNPLKHIDHPVHGFVRDSAIGGAILANPLNSPRAPAPQSRVTGNRTPQAWPPRRAIPGSRLALQTGAADIDSTFLGFAYRGPSMGYGRKGT